MVFKLYTGKGDKGDTGLFGGTKRVSKSDPRMDAIGDVDELNSILGLAIVSMDNKFKDIKDALTKVQKQLFALGADLATPMDVKNPNIVRMSAGQISEMEKLIDRVANELKPITKFILPGGTVDSARLHFARAICRRAERKVVGLADKEEINPQAVRYLNRLASLLFALARWINERSNVPETVWEGKA